MKDFKNFVPTLDAESLNKYLKEEKKLLNNSAFLDYLKKLNISDVLVEENLSNLFSCFLESQNCLTCAGLKFCKNEAEGYLKTPLEHKNLILMNNQACIYKKVLLETEEASKSIYSLYMNKKLFNYQLKDIIFNENRNQVISAMQEIIQGRAKGIYLSGNFGCGKSFLMGTLIAELARKNYKVAACFFPEFIRTLKANFNDEYREIFTYFKEVDVLLLDDLGAEYASGWTIDEILGNILQYRMDNNLLTIITSNFSLLELEKEYANNHSTTKVKRIIERIKYLCEEVVVNDKNYRKEQIWV